MFFSNIYERSNVTILIHDDYCCNIKPEDISQILSQIGQIISNSYHHAVASETETLGEARKKMLS